MLSPAGINSLRGRIFPR